MLKQLPFILLLFILFSFSGISYSQTKILPDTVNNALADSSKSKHIKSAPIVPFSDTLFIIYGNLGAITADKRAEIIEKNIEELAKDPFFIKDSMLLVPDEQNIDIVYFDKVILGITDFQARNTGKSKEELAKEYRDIIISSIEEEHSDKKWLTILKQIGLIILIIGATYFCIRLLNVLFRKLQKFVRTKANKTIKALYKILDADKQISVAVFLLKIIRWVFIILALYFCVLTFFRLFPETRWLSDTLLGYIINPLKKILTAIKNYIPNVFAIIVIIILFRFLIKALKVVAEKIGNGSIAIKGFFQDWAMPTFNIVKIILFVFMFILIFPLLPNSDSKIFQGVSVFLGLLVSLGSTSVISNMVSGIVITYMRPFKVGDRIKMGEFLGNVIEKTPLVTRIRTSKNEVITIPNANIMTAQTVNYTSSAEAYGLVLYSVVTMGYDTPWRKVHEMLIEAGLNTPKVLHDPKPFVLQIALDDFYVQYQINVYTKEANEMANIYSDLNKNIQDIFNREGFELLSPHYRAQRDGSTVTIPRDGTKDVPVRTAPFYVKIEEDVAQENPKETNIKEKSIETEKQTVQ